MKQLKFPKNFLWGAATSAHQVEGGTRNQWSQWEIENAQRLAEEAKGKWQPWQKEMFPEMFYPKNYIAGAACDHYNRFEQDFDLAKELEHSSHRFSIEWSRIEPEEGQFDEKEIEHYRQVLEALQARNIEPFVTLWHWTNPLWLEKKGGCESSEFPRYFARYAALMAQRFGKLANFWVTLNEPTSVIAAGYLKGTWPPQKKNPLLALRVYGILAKAHKQAYEAMHECNNDLQIGFANMFWHLEADNKYSFWDKLAVRIANYFVNEKFFKLTAGHNDFLTVQYYFHKKLKFSLTMKNENRSTTDLGWEIYPEGLYHILMKLGEYKLPIYITENGLADVRDKKRGQFIRESLAFVHQAITEGADVRGYFYWSLLDNFEWDKGFWPRFGLVEVDFKTQERKIRPSALEYAKICKNNELEIAE